MTCEVYYVNKVAGYVVRCWKHVNADREFQLTFTEPYTLCGIMYVFKLRDSPPSPSPLSVWESGKRVKRK